MTASRTARIVAMFGLALAGACSPAPLSEEEDLGTGEDAVIAVVAGREIRLSHLEAERAIADRVVLGRYRSETKRSDLLASIVDREALFVEGWARQDNRGRGEVVRALARAAARAMVASEVRRVRSEERVDETEIRASYSAQSERWVDPPRLRIATVVRRWAPNEIAPKRDAQRAVLERIREEVKRGRSFAEAAKKESEDPETATAGGDIGWFEKDGANLPNGAKGLGAHGDLSKVERSDEGFRLFAVTAAAPARRLPLESVRAQIRDEILWNRVRERLVRSLSR